MATLTEEEEKIHLEKTKNRDNYNKSKKYCITIDAKELSVVLKTTEESIIRRLRDGRNCSHIVQNLSEQLFKYNGLDSKLDGCIPTDSEFTEQLGIGVRCLTKGGVYFTQAAFAQDTSNWKPDHVYASQKNISFNVVGDIVDFPVIYFTTCTSQQVIKFTYETKKKSLSRKLYYETMFGKSLEKIIEDKEMIFIGN